MIFVDFNNQSADRFILCPKCGGYDFTEPKPTNTSTYHVWCKTENCKTDLLIPVKDVKKGIYVVAK